jgi:putative addiction module component (TIGR02574 family)
MNKALMEDLLKLPAAERREIVQELLESLEESEPPPLTSEQMEELDRRLEEHRRDPSTAIPWEEVRDRLRDRFK